tara:strand:+ start:155 stop:1252 length:1098 start_codon:yes stop_codon:yes gene_type:complete
MYAIVIIIFSVTAFINLSPQFGTNPTRAQKKIYSNYPNHIDGEFENLQNTPMLTEDISYLDFFKEDTSIINSDNTPDRKIEPIRIDIDSFKDIDDKKFKMAWLGHSSFMMNIQGKIILLDPMLGKHAAPLPLPSLERYSSELPFYIDSLPEIDIVIISHDHYDHLDHFTIKRIRDKVKQFIVPVGVDNHLRGWDVKEESIAKLNWNENISIDGIEITCLPSRHFSGRGPFNRKSTLWGSWAIKDSNINIYFSGDTGYGDHFKDIGRDYGPFDLVLLDTGQYNSAWKYSHMFPFESVRAAKDLNSQFFMPIHWAGFTLSKHPWDEPIKKSIEYAEKEGMRYIAPMIGEVISNDEFNKNFVEWWNEY